MLQMKGAFVKQSVRIFVVLCGWGLAALGQNRDVDQVPVSILYDRTVGLSNAWAEFSAAAFGKGGDLWVAVNSFQLGDSPKLMLPRLLRISRDGKVEVEIEVRDPSPEKTPRTGKLSIVGIKQLTESTLDLIVSYSGHDIWWVRVDADGKELSSGKLIVVQQPFVVTGAIIEPDPHGVLLYGNQSQLPTAMYIERSGKADWTVQLSDQRGMFTDATRMPDGKFALVASVTKEGSGDSLLVWANSKGVIQQQPLNGRCFRELISSQGILSGLVSRNNEVAIFTTNSAAQQPQEKQTPIGRNLLKPVLAYAEKEQFTAIGIQGQKVVVATWNQQNDSKHWQKELPGDPIIDFDVFGSGGFIYVIAPTFSRSANEVKETVRVIRLQVNP
ncbi:MAG TPA: hypothetical protein VK699_03445 [Terriglobales bacterium]|jgi:hypothetical protein|nr:hypothetical protein [Terriglobales bacterium]